MKKHNENPGESGRGPVFWPRNLLASLVYLVCINLAIAALYWLFRYGVSLWQGTQAGGLA